MSDEAKKKAINFIESEEMTESFCSHCGEPWYGEFIRLFTAGYNQGREDALRWREYPKEKPELGDNLQLYSRFNDHLSIGFLDQCGDDRDTQVFINYCGEIIPEVSHWLPITLPEAKS